MILRRAIVATAFAVMCAFVAGASDPLPPTPACVHWWPEARYRPYGYDHIVHVQNACAFTAECVVSTDVNPAWTPATVPSRSEVEVITWVGSPASRFTAQVWCQLRNP
jgi:hypothetical protein